MRLLPVSFRLQQVEQVELLANVHSFCCARRRHCCHSCAANWASTSRQGAESEAERTTKHWMIRPPPGATPPQRARTSPPHAERRTNSCSRGDIGGSTNADGAAAGAAAASAPAGALLAAPPPAAATAFRQPADSFALLFSRH